MNEPLSTEIVSDRPRLQELATEWEALLSDSDQRSFFLGWNWNWRWWAHFAPASASLFVVVCRDESGRLVGVLPLYARTRRRLALIAIRELHLLGTGVGVRTSEHVGPFARRGAEDRVAHALAARLQRDPHWDWLCLEHVPAPSSVAAGMVAALEPGATPTRTEAAPWIDTSAGWAACRAALGRTMRRNVEVLPRQLLARHRCAFERVTEAAVLPTAVEHLVRLHQARWRTAGQPGSFSDPAVAAFIRDATADAFAAGRLRLWTLRIDGEPQAALLAFADNGVVHYFQSGFNPAYADAHLGTVTLALALRECCDDPGVRAFDFMAGDLDYKHRWSARASTLVRYDVRRFNPRTAADAAWASGVDAAARVYRAAAPPALRAARRRWHESRRRVATSASEGSAPSETPASRYDPGE